MAIKTNPATPHTRERAFGLKEAPTYYPSLEEFKDPLKYIRTIRKEAEQYGIAKIVPPKEYKENLCLGAKVYRFTTRIQKTITSKKGATGTDYVNQVVKYAVLLGRSRFPSARMVAETTDLYKLKLAVESRSGYDIVCKQKLWADIGEELGYGRCKKVCTTLKNTYETYIIPYELYVAKHPINCLSSSSVNGDFDKPSQCHICRMVNNNDLLHCIGCDHHYHSSCLPPISSSIPINIDLCPDCMSAPGGCYGGKDNNKYSLHVFQAFSNKLKKDILSSKTLVSERDYEDKFWCTVNDPQRSCQIRYGIGRQEQDSGIGLSSNHPWNLSKIPFHPDSLSPLMKSYINDLVTPWIYIGMCFAYFCWHNKPHYTYSVDYMHFGDTKTWYGVPGAEADRFENIMIKALDDRQPGYLAYTTPMLSPDVLLNGEIPVYAINQRPGEFVVTFPKAYHSGFNHGFNICEQVNFATADWLPFGLDCASRYQTYQRQPYFSLDKIMTSLADPTTNEGNRISTRNGLMLMLQREVIERQKIQRCYPQITPQKYLDTGDNTSLHDTQLQCTYCHCYAYLSFITCSCCDEIVCLDHCEKLCACKDTRKTMHLRFTNDELLGLVGTVNDLIPKPSKWITKARMIAADDTVHTIEPLQQVLLEATRENATEEERSSLEDYINSIRQLEIDATAFCDTYQQQQQEQHKNGTTVEDSKLLNDKKHLPILSLLQQIHQLSWKSPTICRLEALVDEIKGNKKQMDHQNESQATYGMNNNDLDIQDGMNNNELDIQDGMNNNELDIQDGMNNNELDIQDKEARQQIWMNELEPMAMQLPLNYDTLKTLVKQAEECNLPLSNRKYQRALLKTHLGKIWATKARRLLPLRHPDSLIGYAYRQTVIEYGTGKRRYMITDDLDDILNVDVDVPIIPSMHQELATFRIQISTWFSHFENTIAQSKQRQLSERPTDQDLHNLRNAGREIHTHLLRKDMGLLNNQLDLLNNWKNELKTLLMGGLNKDSILEKTLDRIHTEVNNVIAEDRQVTRTKTTPSKKRRRITKQQQELDFFCICRGEEYGFMLLCDTCNEWYHGDCVNTTADSINPDNKYLCIVCDPLFDINKLGSRPKIQDLYALMSKAQDLYFTNKFINEYQEIIQKLSILRDRLHALSQTKPDIKTIDYFRRVLFGLPVALDLELSMLQSMKFGELLPHHKPDSLR